MNAGAGKPQSEKPSQDPVKPGQGTDAQRTGGIEPAKRQAQKDWKESAKESGD